MKSLIFSLDAVRVYLPAGLDCRRVRSLYYVLRLRKILFFSNAKRRSNEFKSVRVT